MLKPILRRMTLTFTLMIAFLIGLAHAPAHAETTLLPMPAAYACSGATNAQQRFWVLRPFTVTSAATVISGEALLTVDPTIEPTAIDIRENTGVGSSSWPLIGTLTQSSSTASGSQFLATYVGSISLTPGTYWIAVRGDSVSTTNQALCITSTGGPQEPWSILTSLSPNYYYTGDNGVNYTSSTTTDVPYFSLKAASITPESEQVPPQPLSTLQLQSDGMCVTSSGSTINGYWLQLPTAAECTRLGHTLLGWSTSSAFPIADAKEQVDRGWGAIDETFNGMRMIFIPAGAYTLLSGDNTLHPVWGLDR